MKPSALVIIAAVVFWIISACAPIPPTSVKQTAGICPDGTRISDKVVELNPPFDAKTYGKCVIKGSACDKVPTGTTPSNSMYATNITAAFNIAPTSFQNELCNLDKIYIVTDRNLQQTNPIAWGMRERLHPHANGSKHHIAISSLVWTTLLSNTYSGYENWVLGALLQYPWSSGNTPLYAASPDTEELMTLGILAHEMGHILWFDKNIFAHQCLVNNQIYSYYDLTWQNVGVKHGFHDFGESQDVGNHLYESFTKKDIVDLLKRNTQASFNKAGMDLQTIYSEAYWPSIFGFVAPDEDFVEAYKLWVLTNAASGSNLQSLTIQIPLPQPLTVYILQNFNNANSILGQKKIWVDELLNPTSPPQCPT
jgi:hypothetical protein